MWVGIGCYQALRQGLNRVARQGGRAWPARRGGDFRSHRKPAGPAQGNRGLPVKARSRPKKQTKLSPFFAVIPCQPGPEPALELARDFPPRALHRPMANQIPAFARANTPDRSPE